MWSTLAALEVQILNALAPLAAEQVEETVCEVFLPGQSSTEFGEADDRSAQGFR